MPDLLPHLRRRRAAYRAVFAGEDGQRVLRDLFRFCQMDQPCFATDPHVTAFNEGRRRVFLRILGILRMTEADILTFAMEPDDD